jgi:hypothetical protein
MNKELEQRINIEICFIADAYKKTITEVKKEYLELYKVRLQQRDAIKLFYVKDLLLNENTRSYGEELVELVMHQAYVDLNAAYDLVE